MAALNTYNLGYYWPATATTNVAWTSATTALPARVKVAGGGIAPPRKAEPRTAVEWLRERVDEVCALAPGSA